MERKAIYRKLDRYIGIPILFILSFFYKKRTAPERQDVKKIMILKFAALGDILLMIPAIRLLRKKYPNAEITFLSTFLNISAVKKIPYIDKIVNENVHQFLKNPLKLFRYISNMRKVKYDIILDGEQWSRLDSILLCLLKHTYIIGFKTRKQCKHLVFSESIKHTAQKHEVENFLSLLEPLGIFPDEEDKKLEYYLTDEELEIADKFWKKNNLENETVICLHPSVGNSGTFREWGDDNYVMLALRILEDFPKVKFLITGGKEDALRCENIAGKLNGSAISIAGKFKDLGIIKKSGIIVCVNTGIMHLSACLGVKTIALHGPNNPTLWGPYDKISVVVQSDIYCSPCLYMGHEFGCNEPVCMKRIKVDDVYAKMYNLLKHQ
jgi:ADP-heptose:LPS heptosyltransferase